MQLPHDPIVWLLGMFPKGMKSAKTNKCTCRLIAALFKIPKKCTLPKWTPMDVGRATLCIHTVEYYSAIRGKDQININKGNSRKEEMRE